MFIREIDLWFSFLLSLPHFVTRLILTLWNEFGSVSSLPILWEKLRRINIRFSLNVRENSSVSPAGLRLLFVSRLLITAFISLFVMICYLYLLDLVVVAHMHLESIQFP